MKYRKEIDGLRALALLAVIFYHAGFTTFSGGFVGVDIFFVISGYLITTIIINEIEQNSFSLLSFYERRARRILPALFFVMLFTLPFAWFWMLPANLKDYSKCLIAVPLFASNVLFSLTFDYFHPVSELKPLLHTWSLAVEEQYYILFPPFLILAWNLGKRLVFLMLLVVAISSLIMAQCLSSNHSTFTFYSLPTRCFEILIGALVSFYADSNHSKNWTSSLASIAGLMLILGATFLFDKNTPSPSLYSLMPTIGAALILAFANNQNIVGKLLGKKFLVGIGLISYSAYLWHQPIIAFSKLRSLFGFELLNPFLIVGISMALAYLSWSFIEKPFRNKNIISSKSILVFSIIGTILFISIGSIGYLTNGFRSLNKKIPPNISWLDLGEKLDIEGDVCTPKPYGKSGISICHFGDLNSTRNTVLYGDSHSQAITSELNKAFIELKIKGTRIVINGCDVVPEIKVYSKINTDISDTCMTRFNHMLSYIKTNKSEVIAISRWSFKLFPIKGEIQDMPSRNSEGGIESDTDYREYVSIINGNISIDGAGKKLAINHFLDGLLLATNRLYLIYPVPEISWDIARKNITYYKVNGAQLDEISIPYSDFKIRNRFINSTFDEYAKNDNFIPIKPESIFCNTFLINRCVAQYETVPFYLDDDHLSDAGARLIVNKLKEKFN